LGVGDINIKTTPTQVVGPDYIGYLEDVIAIAAGDRHSLALKSDGSVWAWGGNTYGELGQDSITQSYFMAPVQVKGINASGFLSGIIEIAAGYQHNLALKSNGTVVAWGFNNNSQLGDYSATDKYSPVLVSDLTNVQTIEAGGLHSIAVKRDGTVWTWGYNGSGQLGDDTTNLKDHPIQAIGDNSSGKLNLGTYLPTELTIAEDQVSYFCFTISDPEGGQITLWTASNDSDLISNDQFTFSADTGTVNGNTLTLTLTAFQSVEVTLTFKGNLNQIGTTEIFVYANDGNSTRTEEVSLTLQDLADIPSFILKCQWQTMETDTTTDLYGIWALNSQLVYAVGDGGLILKYDGSSWTQENHGYTTDLSDIWGINSNDIVAVGTGAFRLRYYGSSWSPDGGSGSEDIHRIWSDNTYYYTVGDNSEILEYNGSWMTMTHSITDLLYDICGNSTHLYVAAEDGIIYQYANSSWSSITLDTTEYLQGIWVNENTGFVVGTSGDIYQKINSQWTQLNSDTSVNLNAVWATSGQNAYAVGELGDIYHYNGT
ncbi:BNR repeat-containing protein, partial [Candidatus Magnetomorum sp. HK-1]